MKESKTSENMSLGRQGEALAAGYFLALGHEILHQNYRTGHQEVDLITRHEETLHFIEVKTRRSRQFGLGEDAMHNVKIRRQLTAIYSYLESFEVEPDWQLDLLVIEDPGADTQKIFYYESIGLETDD